jgi:hypothetical protein
LLAVGLAVAAPVVQGPSPGQEASDSAAALVGALLGDTPLERDLRQLTDEIGGRPTGSAANRRAVDWAEERFRDAGVAVVREPFPMPARWLEKSTTAHVATADGGPPVAFSPRAAAMPFSTATAPQGLTAPIVDGGLGEEADWQRLGADAAGAWVLVETPELTDIPGLFAEYHHHREVELEAFAAGAAGVVYMSSRPRDVLYRHNTALGPANRHPVIALERSAAQRALRLLRSGRRLTLTARVELQTGGPYESENVIGEIRGAERPDEVVVIGAHLDSWGLGTGALDNGCNVALVIDLARQIRRLGLTPRRTLRFALWNGEEQGLYGSWGYTRRHGAELDRHVLATSFDIGSGRITGFFVNGRPELLPVLEQALKPVAALGPFQHPPDPVVGTDNFDFLLQGVANLVANQESANYGPNYHTGTDTFEQVDLRQLRLNAAIAGAVAWGFAQADIPWGRLSHGQVRQMVEETSLGNDMRSFNVYEGWANGTRGRQE